MDVARRADVARAGFDAAAAGTAVFVVGRVNRAIALFPRMLPRRLLVAIGRGAAHRYRQS